MTVDYDHLRIWLDVTDQGNARAGHTIIFTYPGNTIEIIRELLRLHDGIEAQRDTCTRTADICRSSDYPEEQAVASNLESVANALTHLLNGGADEPR